MKKNLFFSLVFCFLVISCEDQISSDDRSHIRKIGFSEEQISKIGINHNVLLDQLFNKMNFQNKDLLGELKNAGVKLGYENEKGIFNSVESELLNLIDLNLSRNAMMYYQNLIRLLNQDYSTTQLKNEVNNLVGDSGLEENEVEWAQVCASVMINSYEYWIPESKGGKGNFEIIQNKIYFDNSYSKNLEKRLSCLESVVAGDVAGAAFSVLKLGVFGIFGSIPGANLVIAADIAYDTATASASSALTSCR